MALVTHLVHGLPCPLQLLAELGEPGAVLLDPLRVVAHDPMAALAVVRRVASGTHLRSFRRVAKVELEPLRVVRAGTAVLVTCLAEEGLVAIAAAAGVFAHFELVVYEPVLLEVRGGLLRFGRRNRGHL